MDIFAYVFKSCRYIVVVHILTIIILYIINNLRSNSLLTVLVLGTELQQHSVILPL